MVSLPPPKPKPSASDKKDFLVRLSGSDYQKFEELQEYYPTETQSEVVRICIRTTHEALREYRTKRGPR